MNRRSDIDRVMEAWMADGPTAIPDRVVDVVAARIGVQRQRRAWPFQRRTNVTTQIKLIAGLAAALVVAVLGYSLLPRQPGVGGTTPMPSPTPTASGSPSTAPSVGAVLPAWYTTSEVPSGPGILPAGSHTTKSFRPGFTFSVPNGWVNEQDARDYFALFPDTPANKAEFGRSGALAQSIFMGPHSSPYFVCESVENNRGTTAAEMVAAVTANEVLATTGLVDVAIGGLTGKQFDVRLNPDWTGTCPPAPDDPPDLADVRTRVILLDAPGRGVIVIFIGSMYSADFEAFLAEAMPIVESFQFDLTQ
jgi:hypothetical protein